jgi:serine/threonine protein kinase
MSPEQALGAHTIGVQSDIWSLGVTLYEMATGELPHLFSRTGTEAGSSISFAAITAYMRLIIETEPRLFSSHEMALKGAYPPWFITLVDRMLSKDPARRPMALEVLLASHAENTRLSIGFASIPSYLAATHALNPKA